MRNMRTRYEPDKHKFRTAVIVQYFYYYYLYMMGTVAGYWAIIFCYQNSKYSVNKTD